MNMYSIKNLQKDTYIFFLEQLKHKCDSFSLIEPIADSKGFPLELPQLKRNLEAFLISKERVRTWPGTKIKIKDDRYAAISHKYRCCKASIDVLKKYSSFFEYDDQMDISFWENERCMLYTISHEEIIRIDFDYFKKLNIGNICEIVQGKRIILFK